MTEFGNYKSNHSLLKTMLRRKKESDLSTEPTKHQLNRVLGLVDLVSLGVGSTLGLGAYVLAGEVAVKFTGPAVVLSFAFAAVASALSGLCYAEFASRVPKAGSAYAFSYVGIGEIVAFLIGWDLILEYCIGCASIARALSGHIDKPFNYTMRSFFYETFPMDVKFLAPYPDLFSFVSILLLTLLIAWGMRESSILNNIFTVVNLLTVTIVVITGLFKIDFYNWNIPKDNIPSSVENGGEGGFLPFGWSGVFLGAATCFYGFVGFDAIATTGEEAKRPTKDIPLAIVISLTIITLSYCSVAVILTLMWPYYNQDPEAPFPHIYEQLNWTSLEFIVTVGAVFALCTNMIGTLFPLPRILYSMASDGLLFSIFSKVDPKTKTPFWGTIICGFFAAVLSSIFDLQQLMNMMSIGTLMAYTLVCICVMVLRYTNDDSNEGRVRDNSRLRVSLMKLLSSSFNFSNAQLSTKRTGRTSVIIIMIYLVVSICFCMVVSYGQNNNFSTTMYATCGGLGVCLLVLCFSLSRQPQSTNRPTFRVPFVPFVPCLSVVLNIYLMTQLDSSTWIRFAVWLFIGISIYLFYGLRYSVERLKQQRILDETNDGVGGDARGVPAEIATKRPEPFKAEI